MRGRSRHRRCVGHVTSIHRRVHLGAPRGTSYPPATGPAAGHARGTYAMLALLPGVEHEVRQMALVPEVLYWSEMGEALAFRDTYQAASQLPDDAVGVSDIASRTGQRLLQLERLPGRESVIGAPHSEAFTRAPEIGFAAGLATPTPMVRLKNGMSSFVNANATPPPGRLVIGPTASSGSSAAAV